MQLKRLYEFILEPYVTGIAQPKQEKTTTRQKGVKADELPLLQSSNQSSPTADHQVGLFFTYKIYH